MIWFHAPCIYSFDIWAVRRDHSAALGRSGHFVCGGHFGYWPKKWLGHIVFFSGEHVGLATLTINDKSPFLTFVGANEQPLRTCLWYKIVWYTHTSTLIRNARMINPFEARETYIYITKAALFRKIQQLNSLRQLTEIFFFVFFVCFFFCPVYRK